MRRLLTWFENRYSRPAPTDVADQPIVRQVAKPSEVPDEAPATDYTIDSSFDLEIPGRIESDGPGKNILMPDIDGEKHDRTEPILKILDQSSPDVDVSTGFNPYDTVVLHERPGPKKR